MQSYSHRTRTEDIVEMWKKKDLFSTQETGYTGSFIRCPQLLQDNAEELLKSW